MPRLAAAVTRALTPRRQIMQQEIAKQGATLAKLRPQPEQRRAQPAVHAALAMSSVSFPSPAPSSELTAHPGDVLQVTCRALLSGVLPVDDAGYLVIGDKGADLYRPK